MCLVTSPCMGVMPLATSCRIEHSLVISPRTGVMPTWAMPTARTLSVASPYTGVIPSGNSFNISEFCYFPVCGGEADRILTVCDTCGFLPRSTGGGQMPRPVKGSGLAKGSCPIQFQRLTACPCGPNVSLPHYAFACIPRYRGLRLHRRAIDRARLYILPAEADKLPVS